MATDPSEPAKPAAKPIVLEYAHPATGIGDRPVYTEQEDGFDYMVPPLSPQTWLAIRQIAVLLFLISVLVILVVGNRGNLVVCGVFCLMFVCAIGNTANGLFPLLRNNWKHVIISVRSASLRLDIQQDKETTSHAWLPGAVRRIRLEPVRRGPGNYDCWEIRVTPAGERDVRIEFLVHNSFDPAFLYTTLHEALGLTPQRGERQHT